MLDADRSVTIICSWYDGTIDADRDETFTLSGVSVHFSHSASPSNGGTTSSDLAKIRIPYRTDYLPEDQWLAKQKSETAAKNVWTLRVGDTVLVDGQRMTILRWHDNTDRRFTPHWYVEAR